MAIKIKKSSLGSSTTTPPKIDYKPIPVVDYTRKSIEGDYSRTPESARTDLIQKQNVLAEETERVNRFAIDDVGDVSTQSRMREELKATEKKAEKQLVESKTTIIPAKYINITRGAPTGNGLGSQAETWNVNFDVGRLSQDSAKAQQDAIADPTPEKKKLAKTLEETYNSYIERNRDALFYTDKNGEVKPRGNAITRTFANFLPQLMDQIASQVPAYAAGAALGVATGGVVNPATIKMIQGGLSAAAAGKESYNVVRGSAYSNLINLGVPEETAKRISADEAVKSSLVEMAETFISFNVLGLGNLMGAINGMGTKAVADIVAKTGKSALAQSAMKKLITAMGKYGINIATEGLEEYIQEGFAIGSEKEALGSARTATEAEDKARKAEAFAGGATIAALTGGPALAATTYGTAQLNKTQQQMRKVQDDILVNRPKSVTTAPAATTPVTGQAASPVSEQTVPAQNVAAHTAPTVTSAEPPKQTVEIPKNIKTGKESEAIVDASTGEKIGVKYAIVDIRDLITSHNENGVINQNYPSELQPRDRTRISSQLDVQNIAARMQPYMLGESATVQDGAPIVGPDLVVESGNARSAAIRMAYSKYQNQSSAYKEYITKEAERLGIDVKDLPEQPVLVRIRTTESNRAEFARKANVSTVTTMNPTDRAKSDSARLLPDVLNLYRMENDGDLLSAKNQDFVNAFLQKVVPKNEVGALVDNTGKLNREGLIRMQNALIAKAYNDKDIISRMSENLDDEIKNISKALLMVSPKAASVKSQIEEGTLYNIDAVKAFSEAAKFILYLKSQNMTIEEYESQTQLTPYDVSEGALEVARNFEKNKRSAQKMAMFMDSVLDAIIEQGNPSQTFLTGAVDVPTVLGILKRAEKWNEQIKLSTTQAKEDTLTTVKDSEGRMLTEEQAEFFKDSKVRDEEGNLLRVYHGTDKEFTVFRYDSKHQTGTDYGEAYYFTSDTEKASGYAYKSSKDERLKAYSQKREQLLQRFIETKSKEDSDAFSKSDDLDNILADENFFTVGSRVIPAYLKLENPLIHDAGGEYYFKIYDKLFESAKKLKRDGIIIKNVIDNPRGVNRPIDVYIAFFPSQIKSFTNLNPTTSPDIRLSPMTAKEDTLTTTTVQKQAKANAKQAPTQPKVKAPPTQPVKNNLPFVSTATDGIVKRSDIENFLRKSLDIPIAYGKFREKAWGIFKVKPEVIRLKNAKRIPTLFHETGHFIDKHIKMSDTGNRAIDAELTVLGTPKSTKSYTDEMVRAEGVAEFVKFFITDEQMLTTTAPEAYRWFQDVLTNDPNLDHMFETLRTAVENYRKMDKNQDFESNISRENTIVKRKLTFDRLYASLFNDIISLKNVTDKITGGVGLSVDENPYLLGIKYRKWQSVALAMLHGGTFNAEFEKAGKSLKEILAKIDNLKEFEHYMIARRTIEKSKQGINTGFNLQNAEGIVAEGNSKYYNAFEEIKEFQDYVLRQLVTSGILSEEAYKSIKIMNQDFVPMYRVVESFSNQGIGKGFQTNNPIRAMQGSERDVIQPLESIIKNTFLFTQLAERNRVGRALVNLLGIYNDKGEYLERFDGTGKFLEKIPAPVRGESFQIDEIKGALAQAGIEQDVLDSIDLDVIATVFRPSRYSAKDNVITVFRRGKKEYFEVHDEDLYRAFLSMDKATGGQNWYNKLFSPFAKMLRAGAVLNPDFVFKNMAKDSQTAMLLSEVGFVPGYDTIRGLFHVLKKDELFYKAMASGAIQGSMVSLDRDYLNNTLNDLLTKSMKDKTLNVISNPLEALRALTEISENATRLGIFERGIEKYGTSREGVQKASLATIEGTLDFSQGGSASKAINPTAAFFNVKMVSMDRVVRAFKSDPVGMTVKSVAYITVPTILLYLRNRNDPRYEEREDWEKDLFWIIPVGDKIFRWPKPFILGLPFGSLVERVLRYIDKEDPRAFDDFIKSLGSEYVPNAIPTAVIPILEAAANYSTFKGYNIVPESQKGWMPWAQFGEYTSETAKAIGKLTNKSPRIIEHIIYGYGAGLARYGVDIMDVVLKASNLVEEKVIPPKQIEELPIIRSFMGIAYRNAQSINDLYELRDELTAKTTTPGVEVDPKDKSELSRISKATSQINAIRKKVNLVYGSPTYTPEKQKELIDQYTIEMVNIAREALGKEKIK